jgi:hypothetical protein
VLEIYAGLPAAEQVVERYALFGDASLQVRARAPRAFVVGTPAPLVAGADTWELAVDGPAGTVVALSRDGVLYGRGEGDGTGTVTVDLLRPVDGAGTLDLTVTGPDMAAYLDRVAAPGSTSAVGPAAAPGPELHGNAPNPFNPATTIGFSLAEPGRVLLTVHDVAGRRVRTLVARDLAAGRHDIPWNGRDAAGRPLGSGTYLYRLTTAAGTAVGRMTLLK